MFSFANQQTTDTTTTQAPPASQQAAQSRYGNSFVASQAGLGAVSDWLPDFDAWLGEEETPEQIALREQQAFLAQAWPPLADFETGSGGFFDGQLAGNLLTVTLKVDYDFVPGNPADAPVGAPPAELEWTPEQEAMFRADFSRTVTGAWSFKHQIRSTRPLWTTPIVVLIQVVEDASDPHFVISVEKLPVDAGDGPASVCKEGFHHGAGTTCDPNSSGLDGGTTVLDARDNTKGRVRLGSQAGVKIQFRRGQASIDSTERPKLDPPAASLVANPTWDVELTAHTSTVGDEGTNFDLARQRDAAVAREMNARGVTSNQMIHTVMGEQGATATSGSQIVEVDVLDVQSQVTSAHEAGHMFGLGDEYVKTNEGDPLKPGYQKLLRENADLPAGAVPTAQNNDSIMSNGMQVDSWHYAPFVKLLKAITGSPEWTV